MEEQLSAVAPCILDSHVTLFNQSGVIAKIIYTCIALFLKFNYSISKYFTVQPMIYILKLVWTILEQGTDLEWLFLNRLQI